MKNRRKSLSARRAWIEIKNRKRRSENRKSLSARRAWIEIAMTGQISVSTVSLSARRAWIEIDSDVDSASGTLVALRKESVDRNADEMSS